METTKEEMMQLLRELQNLQQRLPNSLHEIQISIDLYIDENSIRIYCYTVLFSVTKSVYLYSRGSYEENRKQLNYFIEYVKKLSKYGNNKRGNDDAPARVAGLADVVAENR